MLAKDIEGFPIEKKNDYPDNVQYDYGFNEAITQQGEVDLSLDREKTAKELYEMHNYSRTFESNEPKWEDLSENNKALSGFRWQADALNANLHKILVTKKG